MSKRLSLCDLLIEVDQQKAAKDPIDSVRLDVPLLIRLLEYSRETASSDEKLHAIASNLVLLSRSNPVLTMDHYPRIVGTDEKPDAPTEKPQNPQ